MRHRVALILLCAGALGCGSLGLGCAGAGDDRFRAPDHATWGDWDDGSKPNAPRTLSRTLFEGPDGAYEAYRDDQGRTVVPQRPVPRAAPQPMRTRPPRVGPKNVHFRKAPLDTAFRMLAEAGRFNLLIEGDLTKPVSGDLEAVDPYDALVALAQVHGARVKFDDDIVIVTAPSAAAATATPTTPAEP